MSKNPMRNPRVIPLRRSFQSVEERETGIQKFGSITDIPLGLSNDVRKEVVKSLNQVLADTMTLRDLYKKAHWQVSGPTFYQLHLLFDKHHSEQSELVDKIAERVQTLGGISLAVAHDIVETTKIPRAPRDREDVPAQISRLLDAHELIIKEVRAAAQRAYELGDLGTNDLFISDALRLNEMQAWFLSEHLVSMRLTETGEGGQLK